MGVERGEVEERGKVDAFLYTWRVVLWKQVIQYSNGCVGICQCGRHYITT